MYKTNQEVFDAVWNGLASQGFQRSIGYEGTCLYRGPDGLKCAVGHLIPDNLYDTDLEGKTVSQLIEAECLVGVFGEEVDTSFLFKLQQAHDTSDGNMKEKLASVATSFGLNYPGGN